MTSLQLSLEPSRCGTTAGLGRWQPIAWRVTTTIAVSIGQFNGTFDVGTPHDV